MTLFRLFLAGCLALIIAYTAVTICNHGWNLFPIFFADVAALGWPGQFNVDFSTFLLLSGLWVAWRHHFRAGGILLGLVAAFGGMLFLSTYLLIVSFQGEADIKSMLLGKARASR